jgi:hypothetical protein
MRAGGPPLGRLPLHPRPLPHEALSSWVDRLARAYGLNGAAFLRRASIAEAPPDAAGLDEAPDPHLVEALSGRTGVPVERVCAMTLARYAPALIDSLAPAPGLFAAYAGRFGWYVPPARRRAEPWPGAGGTWVPWRSGDLLGRLARCCPACLAGDPVPYVRLHWRLSWMASCPLHGAALVPTPAAPALSRLYRERDDPPPAPDLVDLDRITLGAVTTGRATLPGGGAIPAGAWVRALRALLDEVARPARLLERWARDELAAAWARTGHRFEARQGLGRAPFEVLPPERRAVLLAVAGALVRDLAVHRSACGPGTALLHCVTQWASGGVCRAAHAAEG